MKFSHSANCTKQIIHELFIFMVFQAFVTFCQYQTVGFFTIRDASENLNTKLDCIKYKSFPKGTSVAHPESMNEIQNIFINKISIIIAWPIFTYFFTPSFNIPNYCVYFESDQGRLNNILRNGGEGWTHDRWSGIPMVKRSCSNNDTSCAIHIFYYKNK